VPNDATMSDAHTPAFDTLDAFEAEARRRGFDEITERHWPPATVLDTHTHPFDAWAQVSRGEMWLTVGGQTQHLRPGQQFNVGREVPHAERYGAEGASYWVARRNLPR
jgi:mannose-6-phosphate isomerase-like protein (cupin superfamily)